MEKKTPSVQELCDAAGDGDTRLVAELLSQGVDVNGRRGFGWTPAHRAAMSGCTEALQSLITAGAKLDLKDNWGRTPLHEAAQEGHSDCAQQLIRAGAQVGIQDENGDTALALATSKEHIDVCKILLSHGVAVDEESGDTALITAARRGQYRICKTLVAAGVDVNHQNNQGDTALIAAAKRGWTKRICQILISAKANIRHENRNGQTAAEVAAKHGNKNIANLLKEAETKEAATGSQKKNTESDDFDYSAPSPASASSLFDEVTISGEEDEKTEGTFAVPAQPPPISTRNQVTTSPLPSPRRSSSLFDMDPPVPQTSQQADNHPLHSNPPADIQQETSQMAADLAEKSAARTFKSAPMPELLTNPLAQNPASLVIKSEVDDLEVTYQTGQTQNQSTLSSQPSSITNSSEVPEDIKVEVLLNVIDAREISSSIKTHTITRTKKALVQKDNRLKELESQASGQQTDIREKESEIAELKKQLDKVVADLERTRRHQDTQVEAFQDLSNFSSQIKALGQQLTNAANQHMFLSQQTSFQLQQVAAQVQVQEKISTIQLDAGRAATSQIQALSQQVSNQQLHLSDQIHQTGRALSQQMQYSQQKTAEKIQLDAGRAATINVKCKNYKLQKHQENIERHLEPDSELLDEFFGEGIIDPDERRVIESDSEILGKRKRILLLLDRDDEGMSSDAKYRKVVHSLKECRDTGSNYALGQILEKDL